jgi:hypothetical protein
MRRQTVWILVVGAFVVLTCLGRSVPAMAAEACHTRNVLRTFLQPWRADATRSAQEWSALFAHLRRLGFSEVVLQWTSYGSFMLYNDSRPGYTAQPYLDTVVHTARQHQIKLWLGLHYDPDFWSNIERAESLTAAYLNRRLLDISMRLNALVANVERADPAGDTVGGWYLSDEIDDVNWQTPARKDMLLRYLKALRRLLHGKRPAWPAVISGFANGKQPPQQWAAFWQEVLQHSGIDTLLFQDGIGSGKLLLAELAGYLAALGDRLGASHHAFGVIVELFRLPTVGSEQTTTEAAAFPRIVQQLELARAYSQRPITVFSAPDHLLPERGHQARELNMHWVRDLQACHRTM